MFELKQWGLKGLTEIEVKQDLKEAAYFLDKCADQTK